MENMKNAEWNKMELKNWRQLWTEEDGMGTVEIILIIVEKPNAKHRYVLCGK